MAECSSNPLFRLPKSEHWFEWAVRTGDWIAAAMELTEISDEAVIFNGQKFDFTVSPNNVLERLDPAIKVAALDFGLHSGQVERFYGRVLKRLCRELSIRRCCASSKSVTIT